MKTNHYFKKYFCSLLLVGLLFQITGAYAQLAKCKGKYLGNIIQGSVRSNYNTYWNQATSENGSKWGSIEGTRGVYNWSSSDLAYNWAKNNNGAFKFHTFIWGAQTPGWVSSASTTTITTAVQDFIKACSTHYTPMGGLNLIDVLNEPVNTAMPGNMKAALTAGYQAEPANAADKNNQYGWVIWGFQLARKYFPNATLLINEYNVEMNWNNCRAPYIAMALAVKNAPNLTDGRKNLIDGVGLQCHGIDNLTAANFKACIDEIWTKTGLPVHITEFDQTANPNEAKQQSVYSSLIPVAWEHPHVAGITLWGYVQGSTWIGGNGVTGAGGTDSGIIYASGGERPAMTWLKQYMAGRTSLSCCPAPGPFASCSTTNTPPTVSITAPAAGATFSAPASITISASAADVDGTVSSVQFYNGTTLLGSDATAPYSFTWASVAAGTYSITAKATDNSGDVTTSTAVSVVVNTVVNTAPTVSITAPTTGSSFTAPASITISASASDVDGTVSNVQFYNGTTLLGSDATAPYSFSWTSVAAGTYSITARATDNSGAITTSAAVAITVTNPTVTQSPYSGTPSPIPGKIEVENYDLGGQGVAFNETTTGNDGNVYRTDNVDIEATTDAGGGYNVGWIASGEWLEYTVNVTAAGTYNLEARVASQNAGTTFHVEMDGINISGVITVPNTTAWQTFQTVTIPNINLTAGQKIMRITFDASWFNLNYVAFTSVVPNTPPTVSITTPVDSASFTAPATIAISASASDADGTVSNVQFYNGTTLLGSDATAPYSFSWTSVAAGAYSITAKATDNSGAITASAPVTIIVKPGVNVAPTVSITAPSNNAAFTAPASVTITASASDADGTVSSVQFFNGTTLLGSDATAPYSFSWTSVAAGTYSITAKATDNSGAVTTSTAVSITVTAPPVGDITGPDCGSNNTTITFSLNPANRTNATSYNWWYTGSAASTAMVTTAPYSVNIQTGAQFSAGQVCVGVNMSVAPWYKQYCKSITKCNTARSLDDLDIETPVQENIVNITMINTMGTVVYSGNDTNVLSDNNLAAGIYNVYIRYESGRTESKKILNVK